MNPVRFSIRGLSKAFGSNRVLRDLSLEIVAGEIHALIGGNGAGKSTLMKIIAGIESRDAGEMSLDGVHYQPTQRLQAAGLGVVMVMQELTLFPTLSVEENLFLARLPTSTCGIISRGKLRTQAKVALERVGLGELDPETSASILGVGHQQLIEIAAGLAQQCRLLILDEPTAALTGGEIDVLFRLLKNLRAAGTSIIYISHRLEELASLADRVSVLRDGQLVATLPIADTSRETLIQLMAGVASTTGRPNVERGTASPELALRIKNLAAGQAVRGVSLDLRAGEILGLGGLIGAGRTELLRAIYGADPVLSGNIFIGTNEDEYWPRSPGAAMKQGFAFVPEDRKQDGILAPLSVSENAALVEPARPGAGGFLNRKNENLVTSEWISSLAVRCSDLEQPIGELSGGNQQKIVFARWLRRQVKIWLLDEPTRGVDVEARRQIYGLLRERASAGEAILVASSDYDELATLCDRVLVMSAGKITGEFTRENLRPDDFMTAAFRGIVSSAPTR